MIKLLSKLFEKEDLPEAKRRTLCGTLCGILGIVLNILLFAGKLTVGIISGSVSVIADAFNNLSDAGSSIVTICGFKLAAAAPDPKHPYGHGRAEYISGLVISAVIIVMAFELFKESVGKIIHPESTEFTAVTAAVLIASVLVKCYMAYYNSRVGKMIDSSVLTAAASDSLNDCITTAVVLGSGIIGSFTALHPDGWSGVLVSAFIFYSGLCAARDSIDPLLGDSPSEEFVDEIERTVLDFSPDIVGVHDLMVHDYGPGRKIISLHAEVPSDGDILALHDVIDNLERKLSADFGCVATIHMDPVDIKNPRVTELREKAAGIVKEIYSGITIHDFRVVFGSTHTNLIFDMAVPFECPVEDSVIKDTAAALIGERLGREYYTVTVIDRESYAHDVGF